MEIFNLKKINSGCLLCCFDVSIPEWGLTIAECKLFEKDGRKWVGFPSKQTSDRRYVELVSLSKEMKAKFEVSCLAKLAPLLSRPEISASLPSIPF